LRAATPSAEDFSFLVVNDLHYFDSHCGPWFERAIRQLKATPQPVDFCLLVGDLSENGKADQLGPVREIFGTLGVPVHVVIGNHDYRGPADRKAFEELFPRSLNYRFEHNSWQFLALDSSHGQRVQVSVQAPALQWLDDTLPALDRRRPTIVFTHFPLGPWVPYRITNADAVLDRFKEFNLRAVFNGHFHGFTERLVRRTSLTTNRCCSLHKANHDGSKEKGYFLCKAAEGRVRRTFFEVKSS
jgi:hypothetical protein